MGNWSESIAWEKQWWKNCNNTLLEEQKQLIYATKMGLAFTPSEKTPYNINLEGKSVIDIGGGPCSLLLKCYNAGTLMVVDPLEYPEWVQLRYETCGIKLIQGKGEDLWSLVIGTADEVWIYNCLQHTEDPYKIITNAQKGADIIRIFEWIDTSASDGHLHTLTEDKLNEWLNGNGKVGVLNGENGCRGKYYTGVFPC